MFYLLLPDIITILKNSCFSYSNICLVWLSFKNSPFTLDFSVMV